MEALKAAAEGGRRRGRTEGGDEVVFTGEVDPSSCVLVTAQDASFDNMPNNGS